MPPASRTERPLPVRTAATTPHAWWLWLHLLGLDAPIVALVWQDWWSRAAHEPLLVSERLVLGFGVWLIYLADRVADVLRSEPEEAGTARHTFAAAWQKPLLILSGVVATGLVVSAPLILPFREFQGGLGVLAAAGTYFWLIHRGRSPAWTRRLPKEAVVGGMFALGTVFFTLCRFSPASGSLIVAAALFGVVCFLNCALITSWERSLCDRRDPASLLNAFPVLVNGGLVRGCWLTGWLAAVLAVISNAPVLWPVSLAAVALALLDRARQEIPADALRCLADAVLLTPCVCYLAAAVYQ